MRVFNWSSNHILLFFAGVLWVLFLGQSKLVSMESSPVRNGVSALLQRVQIEVEIDFQEAYRIVEELREKEQLDLYESSLLEELELLLLTSKP